MTRGGRRPGAGAPLGNLNGLKHGKHSRRFQRLVDALAQIPETRDLILAYHRHELRKKRRVRRTARALFIQLLLQLPPQPDEKLNQVIDHLRKLATDENCKSNQLLEETNQKGVLSGGPG